MATHEMDEVLSEGEEFDASADYCTPTLNTTQEKCSICLQIMDDMSLLDPCYHSFCFVCIYQWYQFNPTCPLCKGPINAFLYDIRSDTEFKTLDVRPKERKRAVDRWGCPSQELQFESSNVFPFTPAHERRKRVYQRQIIPISIHSSRPLQTLICMNDDWDRKLKQWIKRELQSILEEENVDTLLLMFQQIIRNHNGDLQSPQLFTSLEEFLQHYTPIFIRELRCFISSNLNMHTYDKHVRYCDTKELTVSRRDNLTK